jgi:hypothetical protein
MKAPQEGMWNASEPIPAELLCEYWNKTMDSINNDENDPLSYTRTTNLTIKQMRNLTRQVIRGYEGPPG